MKYIWSHPNNYPEMKKAAVEAGILFSRNTDIWIVRNDLDVLVGCCGILIGGVSAVFKCDFVFPEFRGRRLLDDMIRVRKEFLRVNYPKIKTVTANCTPMAVKSHLRNGAEIQKIFKNGIVKVKYQL